MHYYFNLFVYIILLRFLLIIKKNNGHKFDNKNVNFCIWRLLANIKSINRKY